MDKQIDVLKKQRLDWIDGLRGICCILIFVHHFLLIFYPGTYSGNAVPSHMIAKLDIYLAQSPFASLFNGNFLVCIFCVVSAVSISYSIFRRTDLNRLSRSMIKRFPRLALPLFVTSLLVYFMIKLSLFENDAAVRITQSWWLDLYYKNDPELWQVFRTSFIDVWFVGNSEFSTAFWMLKYIFYGSFATYILSIMAWNKNKKILFVYLLTAVAFLLLDNLIFNFILGTILGYFISNEMKPPHSKTIGVLLILLGMFLGGYPTGISPDNVYRFFPVVLKEVKPYFVYHSIGAFLMVAGLYYLDLKLLKRRLFLFLGKISYAVYLLHIPVLFSFSTKLFVCLYSNNGHYQLNSVVVFILSLLLLCGVAFLFYITVERGCYFLIDKILNKLSIQTEADTKQQV
ncbi:MAG: acyltransferase [Clostridiales bacterium]|nr:acyltransferase [Clostridiales bacterium]